MTLSPEEIQQITRTVIDRLAGRNDADSIQREVRAVLDHAPQPEPPQPDETALPKSAEEAELPELTPMTAGSAARSRHPQAQSGDDEHNRVIVATFGRNRPGVAAALTGVLAECNCDIADITQKILQEFFSMIMIVDMIHSSVDFPTLRERLAAVESRLGVTIVAQHEDVFRAMHRI